MSEGLVYRVYKIEHEKELRIFHHFDFKWPNLGVFLDQAYSCF